MGTASQNCVIPEGQPVALPPAGLAAEIEWQLRCVQRTHIACAATTWKVEVLTHEAIQVVSSEPTGHSPLRAGSQGAEIPNA